MIKAILKLRGPHPKTHPPRVGDFVWSEPHGAYIYEGRELGREEFNAIAVDVIKRNSDRWPWPNPVEPEILKEEVRSQNDEVTEPEAAPVSPAAVKVEVEETPSRKSEVRSQNDEGAEMRPAPKAPAHPPHPPPYRPKHRR